MEIQRKLIVLLLFANVAFGTLGDQELTVDGAKVIWNNNSQTTTLAASSSTSESVDYIWPIADGNASEVLITDGFGALGWAEVNGVAGTHDLLSATHPDTIASAVTTGDIIFGNATPKWDDLAIGAADEILRVSGGLPDWQATTFITDLGTVTTGTWNAMAIDISDYTNLTVTAPITLTDDDIGITVAKDLVTTSPLTGGTDNILSGSDADITLAITVLKDIVAGAGLSGGEDNVLPGADADTTLAFDATELDTLTWDAGSLASIAWTWNLSAGDPTITFGNDLITLSNSLTVATGKNITLGTTQWNSSDEIDGTKIKDADYGDVDVSAGGAWTVSSVQNNSVTLTTDTVGNYVATLATTSPLNGGTGGSEGATLTITVDDADDAGGKGVASFDATDFDDDGSGGITIVDDGHAHTGASITGFVHDDADDQMLGKLTITKTTQQLELEYDGSKQADFTVNSGGDLTVTASGEDISFDNENLSTTGTLGAGAITGTSLTDGTATLSSGSLANAVNGTFSGTVQGETLTDGYITIDTAVIANATAPLELQANPTSAESFFIDDNVFYTLGDIAYDLGKTDKRFLNIYGMNVYFGTKLEMPDIVKIYADGTDVIIETDLLEASNKTLILRTPNVDYIKMGVGSTGGNIQDLDIGVPIISTNNAFGTWIFAGSLTAGTLTDGTFSVNGGAITGATNTNWDAAYNHISSDGTDHTYIDQDLQIAASPTFAGLTVDGTAISLGDGTNDFTLTLNGGNDANIVWLEDEETLNLQVGGASLFEFPGSTSGFIINDKVTSDKSRQVFTAWVESTVDNSGYLAGFYGGYMDSGASAPNVPGTIYGVVGWPIFMGSNVRIVDKVIGGAFAFDIDDGRGCDNLTINKGYGIKTWLQYSGSNYDADELYGVHIGDAYGGDVNDAYGLYIETIDSGSVTNRAIYSAGGDSIHVGHIRFGDTTAPTAVVDIKAGAGELGLIVSGTVPAVTADACDVLYVSGPAGGQASKTAVGGKGSSMLFAGGAGGSGFEATQAGGDGGNITLAPGAAGADTGAGTGTAGAVFIGGDTNYSAFAASGILTMGGDARVKKEIIIGSGDFHKGSSAPDDGYINATVHTLDFDKTTTQHGHYNTIIPQDFAAGTEITVEVDWFFDDVEADHYMTWEIQYLVLADGEDPATAPTTIYQKSVISTGNNDKQIHTTFGTNITGATVDDTLLIRFSRDANATNDTDDLNQDARMLVVHLHYISDKLGEAL